MVTFPMLDEEWMQDRFQRDLEWFKALDSNPADLHEFLNNRATRLVGKKFEALLEFWFSKSPWFELVATNVQFHSGDGTRGEADFLVRDLYSEEFLHIEVACKYYWSSSNSSDWYSMIGPNKQDRLGLKMQKFKRQTKLFQTAEGKAFLLSNGLPSPISVVWLKGYFFYAFYELGGAVFPKLANKHHHAGWFVFVDQLEAFQNTPKQWVVLPRTHWISPYHSQGNELPILTGQELFLEVRDAINVNSKAVLVAQLEEDRFGMREVSRGLVLAR
ncbi:MAG: DUF1853 family protein [Flavobacteriales bacterium]